MHCSSVVPLAHPVPEATSQATDSSSVAHVATPTSSMASTADLASCTSCPTQATRR